jgi:hypothetical protein
MEFFITLLFFFCSFICQLLLEIHVPIIYLLVNYGVVLLLAVVSLTVKSTTGVPMSRGNVDTKPRRHRLITTANATTGYFTTNSPEYNP